MKKGIISAGMSIAMLAACASTASAQLPYRQPTTNYQNTGAPKMRTNNRPTVSPYVNLLSGRGIGFEYYGRVRPQQEFRKTAAALGRSIQDLQASGQSESAEVQKLEIGTTGHAAYFMSQSKYFNVGMTPTAPASHKSSARNAPKPKS